MREDWSCTADVVKEIKMQRESLIQKERKQDPTVWQFRWSDKGPDGRRIYRKRVIGTVEEYLTAEAARHAVKGLLAKPRSTRLRLEAAAAMRIAELCLHFQQHELTRDDHWRSYSTRRNYLFCLRRWIIPRWGRYVLDEVRTIEVESWLRSLPRARST
jgi:integrase